MSGVPVVIASNGLGLPVRQVTSGAPVMTVASNGRGIPIVLSSRGVPFVVEGTSYDLTTYYAAMTVQPSDDVKPYLQTFANAVNAEPGLLAQVRALYVTAMGDLQQTRVNMFHPSEVATIVNGAGVGLTFVADGYVKGDGTGAYVDSGIADNNAAPWGQDAGGLAAYVVIEPSVAPIIGLSNSLTTRLTGVAGNAPSGRIHNSTAATGTTANCFGLILANRTGPTTVELDRDGTIERTQTTGATVALVSGTFCLFRNSTTGFGDGAVALWAVLGTLTTSQRVAFDAAVIELMTNLGVA